MIDLKTERIVSFREAAEHFPRIRGGRPVHRPPLGRWANTGLRGIRLDIVQVGGTRCTSIEALDRLFRLLTDDRAVEV